MTINVELSEKDLKQLILAHLKEKFNDDLTIDQVKIETKSKQNFKSEWETAAFRATVTRVG